MSRARAATGTAALAAYRGARRARGRAFSLAISGAFAEFGAHTVLAPPVDVRGARRIALGAHVWVGPGSWLYAIPEAAADDPVLVVGDGVRISGDCVLSAVASVRLGRDVLLARNVYISDHSHAYEDVTRPVRNRGVANVRPVTIGDGAWLQSKRRPEWDTQGQHRAYGHRKQLGRAARRAGLQRGRRRIQPIAYVIVPVPAN